MSSTTEDKLWVICPVCHKANPAGAHFCEHCWGAAIHTDTPLTTEEMEEITRHREAYLKRRKGIKLAVIGLSVLALLSTTFFSLIYFTDVILKPPQNLNSNSLPGEWAMFHHDLGHSGSPGATSTIPQGTLKWVFKTGGPIHSSPAIANGNIYIGSQDYKLYAIDADSGTKRWEYETESWVESSPSIAKGKVYFGSNDSYLYALNAQTGEKVWDFKTAFPVRSAPAIAGDIVYFGSDDYYLYAIDTASGKKLWDYGTHSPAISPPAVANGIVYIGAADGYAYAFNALNGQRRLRFRTHYAVYGAPIIDGSTIYLLTNNGFLYAADGNSRTKLQEHEVKPFWLTVYAMGLPGIPPPPPQSGLIWSLVLKKVVTSSPVLSGDTIYAGMESKLVAVDLKNQKILWSFKAGGIIRSTPAVVGNTVFVGSDDGRLYAVDATSGEKLWDFPTGGPITSSPAVADGVVYVGSDDGNLYAIK